MATNTHKLPSPERCAHFFLDVAELLLTMVSIGLVVATFAVWMPIIAGKIQ